MALGKTDIGRCCSLLLNLPIPQAFLYHINGYRGKASTWHHIVNRSIVCSAHWFDRLWSHGTVCEGHGVGSTVGLALVATLVIQSTVLWLGRLNLK